MGTRKFDSDPKLFKLVLGLIRFFSRSHAPAWECISWYPTHYEYDEFIT